MSTIDDIPPRKHLHIVDIIQSARELMEEMPDLSPYEALDIELRVHQSSLDQDDRDFKDEQLKGLNDTLREIAHAIEGIGHD